MSSQLPRRTAPFGAVGSSPLPEISGAPAAPPASGFLPMRTSAGRPHTKATTPRTTQAVRHPLPSITAETTGDSTICPTMMPSSAIPMAIVRRPASNHLEMVVTLGV